LRHVPAAGEDLFDSFRDECGEVASGSAGGGGVGEGKRLDQFAQIPVEGGQVWALGHGQAAEGEEWDEAMRSLLETLEGRERGEEEVEAKGEVASEQDLPAVKGMEWTWEMGMVV